MSRPVTWVLETVGRFGAAVDRYCSESAEWNLRENHALRDLRTTESETRAFADEPFEFRAHVCCSILELCVEFSDACAEDE